MVWVTLPVQAGSPFIRVSGAAAANGGERSVMADPARPVSLNAPFHDAGRYAWRQTGGPPSSARTRRT